MSTNSIILVLIKLFVIGIEPILLLESDFKSDVSTNSTKRIFIMAQFDSLIILPLILSLIVVLIFHYNMSIEVIIPDFFGVKKFREKKSDSPSFYMFFNDNAGVNLKNSYKPIFY